MRYSSHPGLPKVPSIAFSLPVIAVAPTGSPAAERSHSPVERIPPCALRSRSVGPALCRGRSGRARPRGEAYPEAFAASTLRVGTWRHSPVARHRRKKAHSFPRSAGRSFDQAIAQSYSVQGKLTADRIANEAPNLANSRATTWHFFCGPIARRLHDAAAPVASVVQRE